MEWNGMEWNGMDDRPCFSALSHNDVTRALNNLVAPNINESTARGEGGGGGKGAVQD